MILPIKTGSVKITSKYGYRYLNNASQFHCGLDIVGLESDKIISVCDGKVLWSQIITDKSNPTWQWGNYVAVSGVDGNTVYYCHMSKRLVKAGQKVKAGDVIGIVGNTGYSFGEHLHFEVRQNNSKVIDPAAYLHLPNTVGTISSREYYSDEVCSECGFLGNTRAYFNKYRFAPDLWRKLAILLQQKHGKELSRAEIIKACGFVPNTVNYIDRYTYASDFWKKIGKRCV